MIDGDDLGGRPPRLRTVEGAGGVKYGLRRMHAYIRRRAKKIAGLEYLHLFDDLVQEGIVGLWEADLGRVGLDTAIERRYVTRKINSRIWKALRREIRQTQPNAEQQPVRRRGLDWRIGDTAVGLNNVVQPGIYE